LNTPEMTTTSSGPSRTVRRKNRSPTCFHRFTRPAGDGCSQSGASIADRASSSDLVPAHPVSRMACEPNGLHWASISHDSGPGTPATQMSPSIWLGAWTWAAGQVHRAHGDRKSCVLMPAFMVGTRRTHSRAPSCQTWIRPSATSSTSSASSAPATRWSYAPQARATALERPGSSFPREGGKVGLDRTESKPWSLPDWAWPGPMQRAFCDRRPGVAPARGAVTLDRHRRGSGSGSGDPRRYRRHGRS